MGKRTQTILTVLAFALSVALIASTFAIDVYNAASAPVWYWIVLALLAPAILATGVARGWKSVPSKTEIIVNLLIAALLLFVAGRVDAGSVFKVVATTATYMFLILAGFRFFRLIMLSARR